jgi:hypothetical protein
VRRVCESMDVDTSIDALCDALVRAGVEAPREGTDAAQLDRVDAAIAPLRLPAQVRRFWERVDPATLRVWAFPQPVGPEFALDSWAQQRDEFPGMAPAALFLVGYESWNCMSVELDSPLGEGGSLFEWRLEDGGFYLRHHRLSDWLDRITSLLVDGSFERRPGATGPMLHLQDPEAGLSLAAPRAALPPHPVHGDATEIPREADQWPVHWQRLSGIEPEHFQPRGATHSIAELLASDPEVRLEATIAGRVEDLASWEGVTRVRVSDGTGVLAINCPTEVTTLGPALRQQFEFDVVVPPGERREPADPESLPPVADPVRDISQRLMARYGDAPGAIATAVRPLGARWDQAR